MKELCIDSLIDWFLKNKRSLPWREKPSPYNIWISELMSQQTRLSVVIPYYKRWMETFPDLQTLAKAPLERVIKVWEGLGYYSRARSLHRAARIIVEDFGGEIPSSTQELLSLPGIGPYTAAAIRSFAFQKVSIAIDGNVIRFISRHQALDNDFSKQKEKDRLQKELEELLLHRKPESASLFSEALIEFGALICRPQAKCSDCPFTASCRAFSNFSPEDFPKKKKRQKIEKRERILIVFSSSEGIYVRQQRESRLMQDLYQLPILEVSQLSFSKALAILKKMFPSLSFQALPLQQQSFTRYQIKNFPFRASVSPSFVFEDFSPRMDLKDLPFCSGHRKVLRSFVHRKIQSHLP